IDQLASMAEFELITNASAQPVAKRLSPLSERLFNTCMGGPPWPPLAEAEPAPAKRGGHGGPPIQGHDEEARLEQRARADDDETRIRLLECSDRRTEIRAIAKEIKRLVLMDDFSLGDIGLVVRQRATYEDTIARVFEEEGIPCSLARRMAAVEIAAVRAASRLIELLIELAREEPSSAKVSNVADLIKSGYFRLSEDELVALANRLEGESPEFSAQHTAPSTQNPTARWNADE